MSTVNDFHPGDEVIVRGTVAHVVPEKVWPIHVVFQHQIGSWVALDRVEPAPPPEAPFGVGDTVCSKQSGHKVTVLFVADDRHFVARSISGEPAIWYIDNFRKVTA